VEANVAEAPEAEAPEVDDASDETKGQE